MAQRPSPYPIAADDMLRLSALADLVRQIALTLPAGDGSECHLEALGSAMQDQLDGFAFALVEAGYE